MTFDSIGPSVAVQSPRILVRIIPVPVVQSRYDCRQRRRSIQPLVLFFSSPSPLSLSLPLSHRKSRPNSSPVARSMIEKVSRIVPRVFVSSRPENVDHSPPLQIKHFRYRGTDVSSTLVDKHRLVQTLSFLFFFPLLLPGQKNDFDTSIDVIISTQPASRFIALLAVASRSENDSFDPRRYVYP